MEHTPASLLERLRQPGDAGAWGRFVELYTPVLFAWARGLGLQDADAADLVQDVLTGLVRTLPSFQYQPGKRFRLAAHRYAESLAHQPAPPRRRAAHRRRRRPRRGGH
jgi:DNA-directed RNA polymerase specialized sigma24 family protein